MNKKTVTGRSEDHSVTVVAVMPQFYRSALGRDVSGSAGTQFPDVLILHQVSASI